MIDLFEHDLIAIEALENISRCMVLPGKSLREWFPYPYFIINMNLKDSLATGNVRRFGDFIIRVIWKQRITVILAAGSKSPIT